MRRTVPVIFLLLTNLFTLAQQRSMQAVKTTAAIKVDGLPDDQVWRTLEPATTFTTSFPVSGKPSVLKTEVRITYDNSAVYVMAYLFDNPAEIRKGLTERDVLDRQDTDVFTVGFDTYDDNQNGFVFQVTAAGVQGDAKVSNSFDRSWDAVWVSKVSIRKDGWVTELRIPFSAIRFPNSTPQTWGLQFTRFKRQINETSTWSPEDQSVSGSINQWGSWQGLTDIKPPLRLSFSPYLSGGVRVSPTVNGNVTEYTKSGGMDVKYGVNESFTLDMTLIPDFAQVQSDNEILNLSPFEVKFLEYRPFFTEGTELFNKAGLFYARRIGARPSGVFHVLQFALDSPEYKIIKNPGIVRLYNATKLSGRTKKNLGIGVLNAITAPMEAQLRHKVNGDEVFFETEPLTNFNIVVLDQAFKNRSVVTFTNTNVLRRGNSRNANVSALDLTVFDKKNVHAAFLGNRVSHVWGNFGEKNGFKTDASYRKVSGQFQYGAYVTVESDKYDPNDMGFLTNNNSVDQQAVFTYNVFKSTDKFINQRYQVSFFNSYLYKPFNWQYFSYNSSAYVLLKNWWDITLLFQGQPFWSNDYFEPRVPGRVLKRVPFYFLGLSGSTDSRKKAYFSLFLGGAESPLPSDPYYSIQLGLRYRFSDKFQINSNYSTEYDRGNWGFVHFDNTTGEPVISRRNLRTTSSVVSGNYNFTPKMNMSVRMRHYWRQVIITDFFDLKPDGYWTDRPYTPGYDLNFNIFNLDMFFNWDFLLGSRITLGWKNALGGNADIDPLENKTYFRNFIRSIDNPHSNELTLKIVYYLDYLTLRKKK